MVSNKGWTYFTLPSCLAPGNYLLRGPSCDLTLAALNSPPFLAAEALALHSAYSEGKAQFYMGCAQLNVQGSGSWNGSSYLSFPGKSGSVSLCQTYAHVRT
jgi:cellulase